MDISDGVRFSSVLGLFIRYKGYIFFKRASSERTLYIIAMHSVSAGYSFTKLGAQR